MQQALDNFYEDNENNETAKSLLTEINSLDSTVDFAADFASNSLHSGGYTLKSGIKKDTSLDAIEIILDLVRTGKLDPWNIDIVDLYDKYMLRIKELKQNNLRVLGKAILFSSTLLKIKSDVLNGVSVNDFNPEPEDFFEDNFLENDDFEQMQIPTNNIISFDEVLERRTSVRLNRKRTVTLKDLIRHIQFYEDLEKKYAIKSALERKERRVKNYSKLRASEIKELAHDEYVEEIVEKMRQNLAQIFKHEENIELRELCLLGFDRSSAFIALLFLAREGQFAIEQDEFYGKLYVKKEE